MSYFDEMVAKETMLMASNAPMRNEPPSQVVLTGTAADAHLRMLEAARNMEAANRIALDAQAEFRKALAAYMTALAPEKAAP